MNKTSYLVSYGDNTAITKSIGVAHLFTMQLINMGYDAKWERVEAE